MSTRQNQWFVPGSDIAREVITADIQRYLGPDALVRPGLGTGDYQGQPGYWITAYRTLTTQMIQDLRMDSQRWQQERQPDARGGGVAYQDSRTHAARQHWGPSTPFEQPQQTYAQSQAPYSEHSRASQPQRETHSSSAYPPKSTLRDNYVTTPTPQDRTGGGYTPAPPRTAQPKSDQYYYGQSSAQSDPRYTADQQYSSHNPNTYSQPTQTTSSRYPPQSPVAAPGYYIASDGNQYPLSQQPPQRSSGQGRGYTGQ